MIASGLRASLARTCNVSSAVSDTPDRTASTLDSGRGVELTFANVPKAGKRSGSSAELEQRDAGPCPAQRSDVVERGRGFEHAPARRVGDVASGGHPGDAPRQS